MKKTILILGTFLTFSANAGELKNLLCEVKTQDFNKPAREWNDSKTVSSNILEIGNEFDEVTNVIRSEALGYVVTISEDLIEDNISIVIVSILDTKSGVSSQSLMDSNDSLITNLMRQPDKTIISVNCKKK